MRTAKLWSRVSGRPSHRSQTTRGQGLRGLGVRALGLLAAGSMVGLSPAAYADEVEVRIDGLDEGENATICPCFVAGEEAAVWLTSPCDGSIVAIQIFWRSFLGGAQPSVEDSIRVYNGGTFPNPGSLKDELLAPALLDGGLNEFRYQDENQTIPINIPVTAGEEFVVALRFFNDSDTFNPSILFDDDGITPGKNAIRASGIGWRSSESLGVGGDWIIRVIVDCQGGQIGSVCFDDGSCMDGLTEDEAMMLGGLWNGPGTSCSDADACVGACQVNDNCLQFDKSTCDLVGGSWFGPGTSECVSDCPIDYTMDGVLDFFDLSAFLTLFGEEDPSADLTMDGAFDFFDLSAFLTEFSNGCP